MKLLTLCLCGIAQLSVSSANDAHFLSDAFIEEINSKQDLWQAGRNFDPNTPLSAIKSLMGTFMEGRDRTPKFVKTFDPMWPDGKKIPKRFDSRKKWHKKCPRIGQVLDQGRCGSCWAISATQAFTDRYCIATKGKHQMRLSTANVLSCCGYCGFGCSGGFKTWRKTSGSPQETLTSTNSVSGCNLQVVMVNNLPAGATWEAVGTAFSTFGSVQYVRTQENVAWVHFSRLEDAAKAIAAKTILFQGRWLKIKEGWQRPECTSSSSTSTSVPANNLDMVMVSNLPSGTPWESVGAAFETFGEIKFVRTLDKVAWVHFARQEDAAKAVAAKILPFQGHTLNIKPGWQSPEWSSSYDRNLGSPQQTFSSANGCKVPPPQPGGQYIPNTCNNLPEKDLVDCEMARLSLGEVGTVMPFGSKLSLRCYEGYSLLPGISDLISCTRSGEWNPLLLPTCQTPQKQATSYLPPQLMSTKPISQNCVKSQTLVNGDNVCKGSIILFNDFQTIVSLDESQWRQEMKIPSKPDYEFTVYNATTEIRQQALWIQPTVYNENFVENGNINIERNRCTGIESDGECSQKPHSFHILPPVQSARIISTQQFQYGVIEIQAKFPVGDWIAADIRLEPATYSYGQGYESGRIRIILRGNHNLKNKDGADMGSRIVEGSVILGHGNDVRSKSIIFTESYGWRNNFHTFTIIWTPSDISFMVDGKNRQNIMVNAYGSRLSEVVGFKNSDVKQWSGGRSMAPFDKPFHVSIGVSAGGIRDFDGYTSDSGSGKPWRDSDPKAMLEFWNRRNEWQPTWSDNSGFIIKNIKVTAL